ncbi:MAG TPA: gephyrin-like molybdotransferase Glp [Gemmatimonadaceae bacterium]|nr:gephyrin-like molybdotransferase Glp [Gemmatimonadaceae bacterium]
MISVAEASARILARTGVLSGESVATGNAAHRVLSEPVIASVDSPPWDNSSMDGYAVRSADLTGPGTTLKVIGEVPAGAFPSGPIDAGEAMRVMTGAPVPEGADSVIRHEDTDDGRSSVTIHDLRDAKRNIRKCGEDFQKGETIFPAGAMLGIAHIGALAAAGVRTVSVHRRPRVAIMSSGDELVTLEDFTPDLAGRKIVSANSITLVELVRDAGGEPIDLGIAADTIESVHEKFEAVHDADLIITSAGISVGDHDHVRTVFESMGGTIDFWKVRMRPGAPLAFGLLNGVPWIGLSGNPVSAIVTFELFVRPAVRKMLGCSLLFPRTIPVRVSHEIDLAAPLMHFLRVDVTMDEHGVYNASLAGSQSSGVLTAMARSNALLVLPGDSIRITPGEVHRAIPFGDALAHDRELVLQ